MNRSERRTNKYFSMVANKRNWKMPINCNIEIPLNDIPKVIKAIEDVTGSRDASGIPNDDGTVRFVAEGYYNVHGDV